MPKNNSGESHRNRCSYHRTGWISTGQAHRRRATKGVSPCKSHRNCCNHHHGDHGIDRIKELLRRRFLWQRRAVIVGTSVICGDKGEAPSPNQRKKKDPTDPTQPSSDYGPATQAQKPDPNLPTRICELTPWEKFKDTEGEVLIEIHGSSLFNKPQGDLTTFFDM
ncbi:hypothetical protein U1Q18_022274 [Sarracenia purpurea var. burkii]